MKQKSAESPRARGVLECGDLSRRFLPRFQCLHGKLEIIHLAVEEQYLGDQAGPPGLMAGPKTCTVVAVEILVEENMVAPVGVGLKLGETAEDGAPSLVVAQVYRRQTARKFLADLP